MGTRRRKPVALRVVSLLVDRVRAPQEVLAAASVLVLVVLTSRRRKRAPLQVDRQVASLLVLDLSRMPRSLIQVLRVVDSPLAPLVPLLLLVAAVASALVERPQMLPRQIPLPLPQVEVASPSAVHPRLRAPRAQAQAPRAQAHHRPRPS